MINRSNPDTSDITTRVIKSTFVTGGDTCSAMLHVPEGTGDTQLPGILMVGGWGSVQQALTMHSQYECTATPILADHPLRVGDVFQQKYLHLLGDQLLII